MCGGGVFRCSVDEERKEKREENGRQGVTETKKEEHREADGGDEEMQGFPLKGGLNNAKVLVSRLIH